jgi:signal transduction histidine kinase
VVTVSVADNGVGFDSGAAAALFQPFTRLHGARFGGTGIGLTIVRRIVERHGGKVWAVGQPGAGATFTFTLPAAT